MAFDIVHKHKPLDHYIGYIRDGRSFVFSRWSDGEWAALLGLRAPNHRNCDGHHFFEAMGREMRAVLKSNPPYQLAFGSLTLKVYPAQTLAFCERHLPDREWEDADLFHHISHGGSMPKLLEALQGRRIVMVGPSRLEGLAKYGLKKIQHVRIPERDCYLQLGRIFSQTVQKLAASSEPAVCCISAGMPAELLIDKLWHRFGDRHALLDMGSVWDPYVGHYSRSGHLALCDAGMVAKALASVQPA